MRILFWIWFTFLIVVVGFTSLVAMPESLRSSLPSGLQKQIEDYKLRLGIDLSGGARLEYKIDFSVAEKRVELSLADDDDFNDLEPLNKSEVATAVASTLKRRVDPDGTKEIAVMDTKVGENYHIIVELSADVNTPETRAILEKSLDLQFKERTTIEDNQKIANEYLAKFVTDNAKFDQEKDYLSKNEIASISTTNETKNGGLLTSLSEEQKNTIWNAEPGTIFPELLFETTIVKIGEKSVKDIIETKAEKTFNEAKKDFPDSFPDPKKISELPNTLSVELSNIKRNSTSSILETQDQFFIIKRVSIDANATEPSFDAIVINKSEENAKEKIEAALSSIQEKESVRSEETQELTLLSFDAFWKDTPLGGSQFKIAKYGVNQQNQPVTTISFDSEGAILFEEITARLSQRSIPGICNGTGDMFAIFVGGEYVTSPCVAVIIQGGNAEISFGSTQYSQAVKESKTLADDLNSGATPAPISKISEQEISAELGEKAFEQSVIAALLGFLGLSIWIVIFYRYLGFLAILALGFYAALLIFLIKALGIVLTLSGVAGIILSIGMAVDANILIFERIREEIKSGLSFRDAVKHGFQRAWSSIRDSNISSLLTCLILGMIGTALIQAFAITLAIGIIISMFTAIGFTRTLVLGLTPKFIQDNVSILVGDKK